MELKPVASGKRSTIPPIVKGTNPRASLSGRLRLVIVAPMALLVSLLLYGQYLPPASAGDQAYVYGVNQEQDIAEVDLTSGAVMVVGALSFGTQAADQQPSTGYVYYFDRTNNANRFAYWDPATQTNTLVITYPQPLGFYPKRAAFDVNGQLYMMDNTDKLYTVETADGAITALGQVTGLRNGALGATGDMAFAPDNTLYVATYRNLYTVNVNTRVATVLFSNMLSAAGNTVWTGLAYCDSFLYASAESLNPALAGIYRIDPANGSLTKLSSLEGILLNDLTSCPPAGAPPTITPTATSPTTTPSSTPDEPTSTATSTATPSSTPDEPTATATPTATPDGSTPTSTSTPTITSTSTPTVTSTSTPTITSTSTSTPSVPPSPTPKRTRPPTAASTLTP